MQDIDASGPQYGRQHLQRIIEARQALENLNQRIEALKKDLSLELDRERQVILRARLVDLEAERDRLEASRALSVQPGPIETTCPYRGLEAFEERHAAFYFGREEMVHQLVDRVKGGAFVAVVGPSGCGKSSLVRAGLASALTLEGAAGGHAWAVRFFRPGADPVRALAAELVALMEPDADRVTRVSQIGRLVDHLSAAHQPLADVGASLRELYPDLSRILLVADQFEELYTECHDASLGERFVAFLLAAAAGGLKVAITLRADFYGRALSSIALGQAVSAGLVNVLPMSEDDLRAAIELPALHVGRAFEPGLVDRILKDVAGEPGNLPLLEFALTELWARQTADDILTHQAYDEIGKVEGAIARRAEAVYAQLARGGQGETVRRTLLRLTHFGEGAEGTRRRATIDDLVTPRTPMDEVIAATRALADARLLVTGSEQLLAAQDAAQPTANVVEVAHEALIRGWERLRRWLDEDRAFGLWREKLGAAIRAWEEAAHDEGALLRGAPLAEAEGWFAERAADLNATERAFIEQSVTLRARDQKARERRIRAWIAAAIVVVVAMAILSVFGFSSAHDAQVQSTAAAGALALAEMQSTAVAEQRDEAEWQARLARARELAAYSLSYLDRDLNLALLLGIEAYTASDTLQSRDCLLRALQAQPSLLSTLHSHAGEAASVALSPDGDILATGRSDGTIWLWALDSGQPVGQPLEGHLGQVLSLAFSPNGTSLASGSEDGTVRLWEIAADRAAAAGQPLLGHTDWVSSLAFDPYGRILASGSWDSTIRLWDVTIDGTPLGQPLTGHTAWVSGLAFGPHGIILASASADKTIHLWDTADQRSDSFGQPVGQPLVGHGRQVLCVAFDPTGRWLASGGLDGAVALWQTDPESLSFGYPSEALLGHTSGVQSVAFSGDGTILASGGSYPDPTIRLWNLEKDLSGTVGRPLGPPLGGHADSITGLTFDPHFDAFVSTSLDTTVRWWSASAEQRSAERDAVIDVETLPGASGRVSSMVFRPDGQILAYGGGQGSIDLWDVEARSPVPWRPSRDGTADVTGVAFSPDGQTLISVSADRAVRLWDVADVGASSDTDGLPVWQIELAGDVSCATISPDGSTLASGSADGTIHLWDLAQASPVPGQPLEGHSDSVTSLAFYRNSRRLASGSADGTIRLWDTTAGQPLGQPLIGHRWQVDSLAFSPDGESLASGSFDSTIRLWDAIAGQPLGQPFVGHSGSVLSLAFSPDGRILASGSADSTVRLWDAASGQPLGQPLSGYRSDVTSLAFSPDGTWLATAGFEVKPDYSTVLLWDIDPGSWQALACPIAGRNLTPSEWRTFLWWRMPYEKTCPAYPVPPSAAPSIQTVLRKDATALLTSFNPSIATNQVTTVALRVTNAEGLYGYQVAIAFDPAVLQVIDADPDQPGVQVGLGRFLEPGFVQFNTADNDLGTIVCVLAQLAPSPPVDGSGDLLKIAFRAKASGSSELTFTDLKLARSDGTEQLAHRQGTLITVTSGRP